MFADFPKLEESLLDHLDAWEPTMSDAAEAKQARDQEAQERARTRSYVDYRGVWVFVEHERGHVHPVSWELMGKGGNSPTSSRRNSAVRASAVTEPQVRALCDEAAQLHGADSAT